MALALGICGATTFGALSAGVARADDDVPADGDRNDDPGDTGDEPGSGAPKAADVPPPTMGESDSQGRSRSDRFPPRSVPGRSSLNSRTLVPAVSSTSAESKASSAVASSPRVEQPATVERKSVAPQPDAVTVQSAAPQPN